MRVAIVHDWLVSYRGGEKVLAEICSIFPKAPIYTLFYDPQKLPTSLTQKTVYYPKRLNAFRRFRKLLLPWLPLFIESLPLWDYDLIISTSSCVAKGIIPSPTAKHLCYIHSPMRYIWDQQAEYEKSFSRVPGLKYLLKIAAVRLRQWDVVSAHRVDQFIANSSFVAQRVQRYYGRSSKVIHPPIDTEFYTLDPALACQSSKSSKPAKEDEKYFLVAGAFVPYKRFDLAIAACEHLGKRLIVAGAGSEEAALRKLAGRYTHFEIAPSDQAWRSLLQNAQALLFPGLEDFGMVAVEAMACGTPVLAFSQGGARDFIKPQVSGAFFTEQTAESLAEAIARFRSEDFEREGVSKWANKFSKEAFVQAFQNEAQEFMRGN